MSAHAFRVAMNVPVWGLIFSDLCFKLTNIRWAAVKRMISIGVGSVLQRDLLVGGCNMNLEFLGTEVEFFQVHD
jgi:hypothetical protein